MSQPNQHTKYVDSLSDQEIVDGILSRDEIITKHYLYVKCYPLFKSRFDRYYTDCENCVEFINQIYLHIILPGPKSKKSPLHTFAFGCKLTNWLSIVTENYCHQLFKKRVQLTSDSTTRSLAEPFEPIDISILDRKDVSAVLNLMPNQRYKKIITHRYIEDLSNEETAEALGMSMANYYNKHKLAKEQFTNILRKEGLI